MSLSKQLESTLLKLSVTAAKVTPEQLISLIDLTNLNLEATAEEIHELSVKAHKNHVAAICVYPNHLDDIPALPVTRATVVNFPSGSESLPSVLNSIGQIAKHHSIDEIDYVFPYQRYLSGNEKNALNHCLAVYKECSQSKLTFKVILETGAFNSMEQIYRLSKQVIDNGCDFLKTSTGKIPQGASIPAAFAMLSAIKDSHAFCGVKISGGLKTIEQARQYVLLAQTLLCQQADQSWMRLGASGLLDALTQPELLGLKN